MCTNVLIPREPIAVKGDTKNFLKFSGIALTPPELGLYTQQLKLRGTLLSISLLDDIFVTSGSILGLNRQASGFRAFIGEGLWRFGIFTGFQQVLLNLFTDIS